jgi:hypothetical protein
MLKPGGYATISDPGSGVQEMDTFTCAHCCAVTHVKPFQDPATLGGLCKKCMKLVCPKCSSRSCDPIERWLDRTENEFRRSQTFREDAIAFLRKSLGL